MPKQNVPALRLEGFDGEWEEKTIQQISVPVSRVNPNSTAPIMMISSADGFINQSEKYSSDNAGKSLSKYVELHQGELAYNHGASKLRPFGSCFELRETAARVPFVYHCFRVVEEHPTFTSYSLNRNSVQSQLERLVSSGARMDGLLNISFPQYGTVTTHFPTFEEQQAIGAIFTNLDAAINQHTLKHKALQQAKTALMQRMFPQEGQTVPELRLKGFSGEWEETTLGELGSTYGGLSGKKKEDFGHGDAMYVTYKDIFSRALITDTSQCERVEVDASQNEVRYGDIFFTTSSEIPEEVGLSAVWLIDKPNVYLNSFCFGFRPTGGFDLHFLGHVLRSPAVRSQFLLLAQGISRFNISKTKAANISLYAPPTLEEQQAIGAVFTNLDQLIAAEAQYIASLKQAKTALLQRMFI